MTPDIFPIAMLCIGVAAIGNIFSRHAPEAHLSRPASNRTLLFFTGSGLLIGFGFVVIPLAAVFRPFFHAIGLPWLTIIGLDSLAVKSVILVALPAIVLYGERRPLSSIGIKRPHMSDIALGIGAFALGEVAMYVQATLLPHSFSASGAGRLALFQRLPLWLMLVEAVLNGITEEMSARGFAVERLSEVTRSTVTGAGIALALNLMAHLPYWGIRRTILLAPGQMVFLALYLWRRSVAPCAIGHILNDAFPRVIAILPALVPMSFTPYLSYDRQGAIYYRKGDFDRSIQLFTRAIARNPRDTYAFDWRGLAWLNKKDYSKSFTDFAEAIRIDPISAVTYGDRAFAYETRHDNENAIADLNRAIALDPDQANWYEMRARIESATQDWVHAAEDYHHAISLDPSNADLYGRLAYVDYYRDDFESAISDYSAVVRFTPNNADAWTDLAMAFNADQQYQSALDALAYALKINPRSSEAYSRRAQAHKAQKKYDLALADLNKALELKDDDSATYNQMAWFLATCPDPKVRDGKKAIEFSLKSCELSEWKDGEVIDTLAAAYAEAGDFKRAVEFENKAIALTKPDSDAMKDVRARLDLYEQRRPYRETPN